MNGLGVAIDYPVGNANGQAQAGSRTSEFAWSMASPKRVGRVSRCRLKAHVRSQQGHSSMATRAEKKQVTRRAISIEVQRFTEGLAHDPIREAAATNKPILST
ncbi:MAG: hypothetical protein ACI8W3_002280 [Myxococcota bacterium]|jgi:hypothetical protein